VEEVECSGEAAEALPVEEGVVVASEAAAEAAEAGEEVGAAP
jgi:hypothetical protein